MKRSINGKMMASCLVILMAILWVGCEEDACTQPENIVTADGPLVDGRIEGVVIYSRDNWNHEVDNGDAAVLSGDVRDLKDLGGPCQDTWNDCISSIWLSEGWSAVLYERDGFDGDSLRVVTHIEDLDEWQKINGLGDWDDEASSIRVIRP